MNATTTRTERIASIIEKRRPLAQKIERVEANLKSLDSALRNLEDHRHDLLTRVDDPNIVGRLQETDILHHSQQDLKNRVSQPKIKGLTISHSQETRFFTQVQDVRKSISRGFNQASLRN